MPYRLCVADSPIFLLVRSQLCVKVRNMSHFLPFSSEEAEMAQVQAHEKVTSRCLFKAFDNALESQ